MNSTFPALDLKRIGENGGKPFYLAMADHIENQIASGKLHHNERLPNTSELARLFNVTLVTAQQGLARLADKGLLKRVPKAGTFVDLSSLSKTIGIVIGANPLNFHSAYPRLMLSGVIKALKGSPLKARIYTDITGGDGFESQMRLLKADLDSGELSCLLVINSSPAFESWLDSQESKLAIYMPSGGSMRPMVKEAISYLIRYGHRKIKMVSLTKKESSYKSMIENEIKGFSEAYAEAGLAAPEDFHLFWGQSGKDGYEGVKRLLSSNERPDALFINHDIVTRGALQAFAELGISFPKDIALLSHFNKGDEDFICGTPVSKLQVDSDILASETLRLMMESGIGQRQGRIHLPETNCSASIVPGKSCGE